MKIKTKKQMILPQLIEWAFNNDMTLNVFEDNRVVAKKVEFDAGVLVHIYIILFIKTTLSQSKSRKKLRRIQNLDR